MRRALVLLAFALVGGGAFAGAMHGGVCYATTADAAQAFCNEVRKPQAGFDFEQTALQGSATSGRINQIQYQYSVVPLCSVGAATGQSVVINNLGAVYGYFQGSSTGPTTGTGIAFANPTTQAGQLNMGPNTFWFPAQTFTFPSCTVSEWVNSTAADGAALGAMAGAPLLLAACLIFLRRAMT